MKKAVRDERSEVRCQGSVVRGQRGADSKEQRAESWYIDRRG